MSEIGKIVLGLGVLMVITGLIIIGAGKLGIHRMPGDITLRHGNFTFSFPIVSSIVISIILTIILNLLFRNR